MPALYERDKYIMYGVADTDAIIHSVTRMASWTSTTQLGRGAKRRS